MGGIGRGSRDSDEVISVRIIYVLGGPKVLIARQSELSRSFGSVSSEDKCSGYWSTQVSVETLVFQT